MAAAPAINTPRVPAPRVNSGGKSHRFRGTRRFRMVRSRDAKLPIEYVLPAPHDRAAAGGMRNFDFQTQHSGFYFGAHFLI